MRKIKAVMMIMMMNDDDDYDDDDADNNDQTHGGLLTFKVCGIISQSHRKWHYQ